MIVGPETIICINVYEWIKNKTDLQHEFYHIASEGQRGWQNASLLHKVGFKAGLPDIFISRPNDKYHSLWIEVKDQGKKPTKVQKGVIEQLNKNGHFATWDDSEQNVINIIKWFYALND